jgi:cysteine desulfurase
MIYLDSASSYPVLAEVQQALHHSLSEAQGYGFNPSARHRFGKKLSEQLAQWQQELCAALNIAPKEWLWLSGATEANNFAINLASQHHQNQAVFFIHPFAHPSLIEPIQHHQLPHFFFKLNEQGFVDSLEAEAMLKPYFKKAVVVWPYGDNEWGFIDMPLELLRAWHQAGVWVHLDAAQSFAKIAMSVGSLPCQSLTASGHKFGALTGIGGLYLRLRPKKTGLPLISGGGQQDNWRSGTIPYTLILSFIVAWRQWEFGDARSLLHKKATYFDSLLPQLKEYDNYSKTESGAQLPHLRLLYHKNPQRSFGPDSACAQHLIYSQGSSCQSLKMTGSLALESRGFDKKAQQQFLRLSLSHVLTEQQITEAISYLQ